MKPTCEQSVKIDYWLELLRRHWNYALGQRLDWLNRTRCQVDRCSLISCSLPSKEKILALNTAHKLARKYDLMT
uniref:hypothetical protein n=1 Tax=Okeania sp. SIO2F4 TaxID=2607790 RepID=UPI0035C89290